MRQIAIVNQSSKVSAADVAAAVAALQVQISRDFAPIWNIEVLFTAGMPDAAGEKILLLDNTDQADALGYHTQAGDVPTGYVFVATSMAVGDAWQATLSHEAIEQAVDPLVNLGALSSWAGKAAALAYEAADPVENDEYAINGVPMSNFVTPAWFLPAPAPAGTRFDFLALLKAPLTLRPGGYQAFSTTLRTWQEQFGDQAPIHQRAIARYSRRQRRQYSGLHAAA